MFRDASKTVSLEIILINFVTLLKFTRRDIVVTDLTKINFCSKFLFAKKQMRILTVLHFNQQQHFNFHYVKINRVGNPKFQDCKYPEKVKTYNPRLKEKIMDYI